MYVLEFFHYRGNYSVPNGIINFSGGSSGRAAALPDELPLVCYRHLNILFCPLLGLTLL
jgi:hypothetical protein